MLNQLNFGSEKDPMPKVFSGLRKTVISMLGLVVFGFLSGCGTQPPTLTVDETKVALEIEATAMRNFLTFQAATLWPSTPAPPTSETPMPIASSPAGITPLLTNENEGYALRYPAEYHVIFYGRSACFTPAQVVDSRPGACHVANAILEISDAGGQTLESAADEIVSRANPDIEVTRTEIEISGEDAILLDNIYSYDVLRQAVVLHKDRLYVFTFVPWSEGIEEFPRIQRLYSTLIESFTFLTTP